MTGTLQSLVCFESINSILYLQTERFWQHVFIVILSNFMYFIQVPSRISLKARYSWFSIGDRIFKQVIFSPRIPRTPDWLIIFPLEWFNSAWHVASHSGNLSSFKPLNCNFLYLRNYNTCNNVVIKVMDFVCLRSRWQPPCRLLESNSWLLNFNSAVVQLL